MKNIAIIPARSGSKGVIDKNIRDLHGKPLMAYTIEAALGSGVFDEVMVSTDSEKYAQIAREWGAAVPFLRSERTSTDSASSWDMVDEVLGEYEKRGRIFDTFCLLQPTSPLRRKSLTMTQSRSSPMSVTSTSPRSSRPATRRKTPENSPHRIRSTGS